MQYIDFVVKFDRETETIEDLTKKVLNSIIINRLKQKKPVVMFMGADSGEGKSLTALRIQQILCEIQGLDFNKYMDIMNVYQPLQYAEKVDKLLFNKDYKQVNVFTIHEARDLINSKDWGAFLPRAIADVNAQARQIKRLCTIIVSQFIRDITLDVRYTLKYYCEIKRPADSKARLYVYVIYKDTKDIEKPKIKKRKLQGYIVDKNGKYKRFIPQYIEINLPDKEIVQEFEKQDYDAKAPLIKKKLEDTLRELKNRYGYESDKLPAMLDYYSKNIDKLGSIGKFKRKKWSVNKEFIKMHDLSKSEVQNFELLLTQKLKERGML